MVYMPLSKFYSLSLLVTREAAIPSLVRQQYPLISIISLFQSTQDKAGVSVQRIAECGTRRKSPPSLQI